MAALASIGVWTKVMLIVDGKERGWSTSEGGNTAAVVPRVDEANNGV